jgi:basic membrane protein A
VIKLTNNKNKRGLTVINLNSSRKINHLITFAAILTLIFTSCKEKPWKPGMPLPKEKVIIGVVHITDPFTEGSGYSYAHQTGIYEMKQRLGLTDSQILYKTHIDDADPLSAESAMLDLIAQGANIIFATSWGYMDTCEMLSLKFPSVVFAHATGYKYNDTNFTNYFGRVYQARYLSGIVAGSQTKTNKIGFVAAWGTENSEVTGGINAFAIGVERVNPEALIFVKVINSWYDPMGEAEAAYALIASGCDVIAQHCDSITPQIEANKAGVWGVGYNTDMSIEAPDSVLTSVLWNWGAYYIALVQSVIDGSFTTEPWFGSLKDGVVDIAPLNKKINWPLETIFLLEEERRRIEGGAFNVFDLSDDEIRNRINWYYQNVTSIK